MSRPLGFITGATSGIGNAFARELAQRGYDLVLVSRDRDRLETVRADLLRQHGVDVTVLSADLATTAGLADAVAAVNRQPVDLLINNAGASIGRFFGETAIEDEDRQLNLLVRTPMHLSDAALKSMLTRGGGAIVNVSSVAAFTPRGTYSAHKAWITNLSQWMNVRYAERGVVTMALCSGFVRTEFHQRMGVDPEEIPGWMWLRADYVVRTALDDLAHGKAISIPSMRYKVLAGVARYAPPALVARFAKLGRRVKE